MTDDKKLSVADLEERLLYDDDDDAASGIDVRQLLTILILYWRWFVLSVVLCLAGAFAYLRYTTAVYSLSARMLHDETRTIRLELAPRHNTVQVDGQLLCNGQPVQSFNFMPRQLLCVPCRLYAQNRYKDCKHSGSRTKAAQALHGA